MVETVSESITKTCQIAGQSEIVFGSKAAACTLLFIQSYGSGYGAEIARTFNIPLNSVQQQLRKFETNGILVSYLIGKTRVFEFNPRGAAVRNLRNYLSAELERIASDTSGIPKDLYRQMFCQRRRPRRSGKSLDTVPKELR